MTDPVIRTVVASAVRHARPYAEELSRRAELRIVGVCEDPDAGDSAWADARALAEELGVPLHPIAEVGPGVADLAVVCSEPTRHAALAEALLEQGLDVLCDKPLATRAEDARRVAAVAAREGRRCAVVTRALSPSVRRMRELIDAGRLGLPRSIDLEFLSAGTHLGGAVERLELVVDRRLSGGGEMMNFLGYPLEILQALTGCAPVEVFAEASSLFFPEHAAAGVEDVAAVSLLLENGVVASILVGRVPVVPGRRPLAATIRVIGSHGHAEFDLDGPAVTLDDAAASETVRLDAGAFATVVDDLVLSISTGAPLRFGVVEAVSTIETIGAAYDAVSSASPVAFPGSSHA